MPAPSWRDHCRPIIARVLLETRGCDEKNIKKALAVAYPFGERRMHPYKIWCDEVQRQRHKKHDPQAVNQRRAEAATSVQQTEMELI